MKAAQDLFWFSILFIFAAGAFILVPYFLRRRDLGTPTNFFVAGAIMFVGISGIDLSLNGPSDHEVHIEFSRQDYQDYVAGASQFFGAFVVFWLLLRKPGTKLAGRMFRRWPPITPPLLIFLLVTCFLLALGYFFRIPIPGVGQFVAVLGNKALAIGVVVSFVTWYFDRENPFWLALFLSFVFGALVLSIMAGGGRRTLLSVITAVPLAYYWLKWRYEPSQKVFFIASICAALAFVFIGTYSSFRHGRQEEGKGLGKERSVAYSLTRLRKSFQNFGQISWGQMLGQRAVEMSIISKKAYEQKNEQQPFYTIYFIASNPFPRSFWQDEKPEGLGKMLPDKVHARTRATWGPGVVGHGFHEGGLWMLIFYAGLAAFAMRFLDAMVLSNPHNPFVLGILAGSWSHIFGWTRGDIGTFTLQTIGGVLAGVLLAWVGRFFFGTARVRRHVAVARPY